MKVWCGVALWIMVGNLGAGKGLMSMNLLYEAWLSKRPLYTNIHLTSACPFQEDCAFLDDNGDFPVLRGTPQFPAGYRAWWHYVERGAFVLIDEADLYMDALDHRFLGRDVHGIHKMLRKFGIDVVYVVQNISNLYVRLRRLCQGFYHCEHNIRSVRLLEWIEVIFGRNVALHLSSFYRTEYGDEGFYEMRGQRRFSYSEVKDFFGWYETDQLLGDLSIYKNPGLMNRLVTDGNENSSDVGGATVGLEARGVVGGGLNAPSGLSFRDQMEVPVDSGIGGGPPGLWFLGSSQSKGNDGGGGPAVSSGVSSGVGSA